MKRFLALGALLSACFVPSTATAATHYVAYPTIHEREAEEDVQHTLAKKFRSWRHRDFGQIDCRGGRVNRFTWSCHVGWYWGRVCYTGRIRIMNQYREGSWVYFHWYPRLRYC